MTVEGATTEMQTISGGIVVHAAEQFAGDQFGRGDVRLEAMLREELREHSPASSSRSARAGRQ